MGTTSSDNDYIEKGHSEFISVDQLSQILRGQKSTDIYQSQISHAHKTSTPNRKSNITAEANYGNNYNYPPSQPQYPESQYLKKIVPFTAGTESIEDYLSTYFWFNK